MISIGFLDTKGGARRMPNLFDAIADVALRKNEIFERIAGDADLAVTSANLTSIPANWDVWQLVSVPAAEDADSQAGTATIALAVVGHAPGATVRAVEEWQGGAYTGTRIKIGHMLALKGDGRVWAWGDNSLGQLGDGATINRLTPVAVSGLSNVTAIAADGSHSLALTRDGRLWAWGYNGSGQLGDGTTASRATPALVPGPSA